MYPRFCEVGDYQRDFIFFYTEKIIAVSSEYSATINYVSRKIGGDPLYTTSQVPNLNYLQPVILVGAFVGIELHPRFLAVRYQNLIYYLNNTDTQVSPIDFMNLPNSMFEKDESDEPLIQEKRLWKI